MIVKILEVTLGSKENRFSSVAIELLTGEYINLGANQSCIHLFIKWMAHTNFWQL